MLVKSSGVPTKMKLPSRRETKPVDFRIAFKALSMSTPLSVAETFPSTLLLARMFRLPCSLKQVEHLADVFVVDVDSQLAVALAVDRRLAARRDRGRGRLRWRGRDPLGG